VLSRAYIFNGPKGQRLPPVFITGYGQPEAARHALSDVRGQSHGSRKCPELPARADPGRGDGDCAGPCADARETRPRAPVSLYGQLRHVHAEHRTDRRRAPEPTVRIQYRALAAASGPRGRSAVSPLVPDRFSRPPAAYPHVATLFGGKPPRLPSHHHLYGPCRSSPG